MEHMGRWVSALPGETRDTLAAIPAERATEPAGLWSGIEEFGGLPAQVGLGQHAAEL